jgi:hypothetical protein
VFSNGLIGEHSLVGGWVELGFKRIQLKDPPKAGDILQAYYIPA